MTASDIFWTAQIGIIVIFWLFCLVAGIIAFVRAEDKRALFRIEDKSTPFKAVGFLLLLSVVYIPTMLAVEWLIPAQRFHRYIYGIDEYGNPFDRRSIIISILALFVTYLLIRGWRAHREKPWQ